MVQVMMVAMGDDDVLEFASSKFKLEAGYFAERNRDARSTVYHACDGHVARSLHLLSRRFSGAAQEEIAPILRRDLSHLFDHRR